ncbi:MAG TPA: PEP-CTERM sorting domain-containing protein [Pirellulales bacterium]
MRTSLLSIVLVVSIAAPLQAASISGSVRAPSGDVSADFPGGPFPGFESVNLTTKGTVDWLEVGTSVEGLPPGFVSTTATNFKIGGTAIGPLTITTPGIGISANSGGNIYKTWTDGTPRLADSADSNEVLTDGSFSFDVAATGSTSRLDVFTSINSGPQAAGSGLFVATLKDSLNNVLGTYSQSVASNSANNIFTVDFSGAGDHLSVVYSLTSASGTVGLSAATLAAVPEPGSLALGMIAAVGLAIAGIRRRRRAG